jgi:putative flippase GtrA
MKMPASAIRFGLVGVVATLIHTMVATGLIVCWEFHPSAANGVAFITANLVSYVANTCWTFGFGMKLDNWGRFAAVSFAAWVLSMVIALLVAEAGGHYLLGIAMVIALVPVLTFVAHQKYTYR